MKPEVLTLAAHGESGLRQRTRDIALVMGFAVLTALAAQFSFHVPGIPVPVTLQTLSVLSAGYFLGWRRGALSQAAYLAMGACGLPVFAVSPLLPQGLARLLGPTGGYLLAFPVAAAAVGLLISRPRVGKHAIGRLAALLVGTVAMHVMGIAWVSFYGLRISPIALVLPFIPLDLAKAAVLAVLPGSARVE